MLNEICQEIRNWFDRNQPKIQGSFEISNGRLIDVAFISTIQANQYFRIIGSVFNDGVYKYDDQLELVDEKFEGSIWLMAIPKELVALSAEISEWIVKYGENINSPYNSESFGGYSYTKASRSGSNSGASNPTWQSMFASRLNKWRKI